MDERRQFPRTLASEAVYGRVKTAIPARVVDVSQGGVQLELTGALNPASECRITLPTAEGQRRFLARVCRCRAQAVATDGGTRLVFRAGLEFVNLNDEDRRALASGLDDGASTLELGDADLSPVSEALG